MIVSKDRICEFLYSVKEATALSVAKNVGFYKAKHVHITLYQLEKQGDICRQGITPPMWALTDKKRSRMQRKKGVPEEAVEVVVSPVAVSAPADCIPAEDEDCTAADDDDDMDSAGSTGTGAPSPAVHIPPSELPRSQADHRVETAFAPVEGLNTKRSSELEDVSDGSLLSASKIRVLRQCAEKDPVSGLIRYSQYMSQKCEFILLDQSGPSHEPVFEMQAVMDNRRFPPSIGSNKKAAKKEAATIALKILLREAVGGEESEPEEEEQRQEQPAPPPPDAVDMDEEEEEEDAPEAPPSPPPPPPEPDAPPAPPAPPKNPISTLMEYTQRTGVPCEFIIVPHEIVINHPKFTFVVRLGNRTFPPVTASNKKMAKQLAAEAAVKMLEEEIGPLLPPVPEKQPKST